MDFTVDNKIMLADMQDSVKPIQTIGNQSACKGLNITIKVEIKHHKHCVTHGS